MQVKGRLSLSVRKWTLRAGIPLAALAVLATPVVHAVDAAYEANKAPTYNVEKHEDSHEDPDVGLGLASPPANWFWIDGPDGLPPKLTVDVFKGWVWNYRDGDDGKDWYLDNPDMNPGWYPSRGYHEMP